MKNLFKKKKRVLPIPNYAIFANIVENMLVIIDNTGNIVDKNDEFDIFVSNRLKKSFNNFFFLLDNTELDVFKKEILSSTEDKKRIETSFVSDDHKEYRVLWTIVKDIKSNLLYLSGHYLTDDDFVNEQLQLSEEKSRKQFKSIPSPTYTWKKTLDDFTLVDYNDIVFAETEGKVQHLLGIAASKLLLNNTEIIKDMEQCFENRATIKKEVKYLLNDTNEIKYYYISYVYVSPDYVIVQMEEITSKKLIELETQENEEKYKKLYNTGQDSIFLVNKDGRIFEHNDSALEMFGYTTNELNDIHINKLVEMSPKSNNPGVVTSVEGFLLELFNKSMVDGFIEIKCIKKNNEKFPAEIHTQFTKIKDNNILLIFIRDISQRKQMEKALLESEAQLRNYVIELKKYSDDIKKANQELKTYNYIISHDLKAPLRAIHNLAEWLIHDYLDKFDGEGKNLLELLINRVNRMHTLIESILKYTKIGKIEVEFAKKDLNILVKSIIDILLVPPNIKILIPVKLPTIVTSDIYLKQVFQNLIANAIKFSNKAEGLIEIGYELLQDSYKFWVKDNGVGIDPKYHEKIFQLFQTLQPKEEYDSTGIGLSIVKKIIQTLNGSIGIESEAGVGTTFYFTLPIITENKYNEGVK